MPRDHECIVVAYLHYHPAGSCTSIVISNTAAIGLPIVRNSIFTLRHRVTSHEIHGKLLMARSKYNKKKQSAIGDTVAYLHRRSQWEIMTDTSRECHSTETISSSGFDLAVDFGPAGKSACGWISRDFPPNRARLELHAFAHRGVTPSRNWINDMNTTVYPGGS